MDRKDIAGDLRHIAHEVKARHLDGTLSEAILGLCRSIEDEMVYLPTDKEGKPWHIGDRCCLFDHTGTLVIGTVEGLCMAGPDE